VTLGPPVRFGVAVTEVTSISMISELQFFPEAPEDCQETFLACSCFNGEGNLAQ
jgi:hypothetical protein